MSKLQLPNVTCIVADGVNAQRAARVLDICTSKVDFAAVKLLTHLPVDSPYRVEIMPLKSLIAYSIFCLTELYKHFETSHVLIVQRDGWILNPQTWSPDWLNYDYCAPLFVQHEDVGSGGFSLRSKRIMEAAANRFPKWDGTDEHAHKIQEQVRCYEDGYLSMTMKAWNKFTYLPVIDAAKFAAGGNKSGKYHYSYPFGFHGSRQEVNFETGKVSPVCEHLGEGCGCRPEVVSLLNELEK